MSVWYKADKMKRLLILSLIGLFGLSCFFVGNSEAASITSLSVENGASGCYASLTTDENIWVINWYAKQTYPETEADDDYECIHVSGHADGQTSVCVNIGWLEGHIKIAEYDIKAEVIFEDASKDTATDTVDAYKPIVDRDEKSGVYGRAELYSQSYDGYYITIVCYISAYNPTAKDYEASGKFRHSIRDKHDNLVRQPPDERKQPGKKLEKNGGTYYASDSLSEYVGEIWEDEQYNSDAYIRLRVRGIADTWFVGHDEDFTEDDNP